MLLSTSTFCKHILLKTRQHQHFHDPTPLILCLLAFDTLNQLLFLASSDDPLPINTRNKNDPYAYIPVSDDRMVYRNAIYSDC